jgi:hypothetical protein
LAVQLVTAACLGSSLPTAVPNAVDTIVAATMRAITPVDTATPIPSATALYTPTFVIPTLPPVGATVAPPAATRINFLAKATTAVISAPIEPGQTQFFVLNASQGQPMIVMVNSLNSDVTLSVRTKGGTSMLNAAAHQSSWQAMLPKTEDYYIGVYGGATTENFTLTVVIPARIKFLPNAVSATVSGQTVAGYVVAYTVLALKGQTMTVYLSGAGDNAALTIYGYTDGQPYLRAALAQTTFTQKLPATQDYIIEVVPLAGQVLNYTLDLIIK